MRVFSSTLAVSGRTQSKYAYVCLGNRESSLRLVFDLTSAAPHRANKNHFAVSWPETLCEGKGPSQSSATEFPAIF
jgi:hypothetical protein